MKNSSQARLIVSVFFFVCLALFAAGCQPDAAQTPAPTDPPLVTQVVTDSPVVDQPISTEVTGVVQAEALERVPIRIRPGADCPIIGWVEIGNVINLTRRNLSDPDYWYETNFLGPDHLGWVYHKPFKMLNDDAPLPRIRTAGCAEPVTPTTAPAAVETCGPGWLPDSGCTCCGSTLTCAVGTVAEFNPQCMSGPPPNPKETCGCEGTPNWICRVNGVIMSQETCSSACGCIK